MSKNKCNVIVTVILIIIAVVFTMLVKYVDVKNVGPNNSSVGFATINTIFRDEVGQNALWYSITKYLGFVPIAVAGVYALIGICELLKNKSLFKVKKEIVLLGVFLVLVVGVYALFEVCVINYRPMLIDNELEASYPSSHTMLTICICGAICMLNKKVYSNKLSQITNILLLLIMVIVVVGRMLSGVHWITDIIGGEFIAIALLMVYHTAINYKK